MGSGAVGAAEADPEKDDGSEDGANEEEGVEVKLVVFFDFAGVDFGAKT